MRGQGIVLDEPSVIARSRRTGEVVAMGDEARAMLGRTPEDLEVVRPLQSGAVTDFDVTTRMVKLLLARSGVGRLHRARVVVCVPASLTEVERRAVAESARRAGAAEAQLLEQALAAAMGAGLPINEPLGTMVVDVGGGTTEAALISLGGVVAGHASRVGSFDLDRAIQRWVKRTHGMAVGERTAEDVKVAVGVAGGGGQVEVRGRDLVTGLPKVVAVLHREVRAAVEEQVVAITDTVLACLRQAPPDLARDLLDHGIHLVGGGGMLRGLDVRLAAATGVPVRVADQPQRCVVLGGGRCVEAWDELRVLFVGARG